jgi:hypothetical protein
MCMSHVSYYLCYPICRRVRKGRLLECGSNMVEVTTNGPQLVDVGEPHTLEQHNKNSLTLVGPDL